MKRRWPSWVAPILSNSRFSASTRGCTSPGTSAAASGWRSDGERVRTCAASRSTGRSTRPIAYQTATSVNATAIRSSSARDTTSSRRASRRLWIVSATTTIAGPETVATGYATPRTGSPWYSPSKNEVTRAPIGPARSASPPSVVPEGSSTRKKTRSWVSARSIEIDCSERSSSRREPDGRRCADTASAASASAWSYAASTGAIDPRYSSADVTSSITSSSGSSQRSRRRRMLETRGSGTAPGRSAGIGAASARSARPFKRGAPRGGSRRRAPCGS